MEVRGRDESVGTISDERECVEWCEDWQDSRSYNRYDIGDLRPATKAITRVLRGGSWFLNGDKRVHYRCTYRPYDDRSVLGYEVGTDGRSGDRGFRCAMTVN